MRVAPLARGRTLGPFRLVEQLGLGGMAEIWAADGPQGPVALKVLAPDRLESEAHRTMFLDEIRIAVRLAHVNIVRVYEGRELDGFLVQVMERVDGLDLRRLLQAHAREHARVPVAVALTVARDAAVGLEFAHALREHGRPMNLVHRDVSPHNLMVRRDGRTSVLDFGIARAEARRTRTATGTIKGKLSYMAPEQALATEVSPATDVFALGIVLWEMLASRRLYGPRAELAQVIEARVPPLADLCPHAPPAALELVEAMLQRHPKDRPASMVMVLRRLRKLMARNFSAEETSAARVAGWLAAWRARAEPRRPATAKLNRPETPSTEPPTEPPTLVTEVTDRDPEL